MRLSPGNLFINKISCARYLESSSNPENILLCTVTSAIIWDFPHFRQEELRIFRFSGFESPSVLFSLPHAHLRCTPNRDVRADSLHRELRLRPRYDCLVAPCVSTRTSKSPSAYILASGKDAVRPHWAKTDAEPTAARTPPR